MQIGFGPMELLLLMLVGGGFGAGAPRPEDPKLAQAAPAQCLAYSTWSAAQPADSNSQNQTERLLGQPELDTFLRNLHGKMLSAIPDADARRFAELLQDKAGALFLEDIELRQPNEAPVIHAGAVIQVGQDAAEAAKLLASLVAKLPGGQVEQTTIAGTAFWEIHFPARAGQLPPDEPDPESVTVGVANEYLIAGAGPNAVSGILKRMTEPAPPWLVEQRAKQKVLRPSSFSYVNLRRLIQFGADYSELFQNANTRSGFRQAMAAMGFDALESVILTSGLDEHGSVTRLLVETHEEPRGFLGWFRLPPMTAEQLKVIDAESPAAFAFQFDAVKTFDQWLAVMDQMGPNEGNQIRASVSFMEQQLSIRIREDLLESLGSTARVFAQPGPGGLVTGWALAVRLKDRERFTGVHEACLTLAKNGLAQGQGGPSLTSRQIEGREVHVLFLGAVGIPVSPSWCVTEDEFLLAASPESLETLLHKQVSASIATQPNLKSLFSADAGTLAFLYADTQQVAQVVLPMAAMAFQPMLNDPEFRTATAGFPLPETFIGMLGPTMWSLARTERGVELIIKQTLPLGNMLSSAPVAAALLLPAGFAARGAARRTVGANNLKQIALAMHNFHDVYRSFPAGYSADDEGKPLLSWRVHVLPFVEQNELYQQFHLDEPWDSPHNKELIAQMPEVYRAPASQHASSDGLTNYLGVGGKDGVFIRPAKSDRRGTPIQRITDGTSNTIMCVEAPDESAVIWTKPADFAPNADNPLKGLLGLQPGGFQAAFADGSVHFLSEAIDKITLIALFTKSGGEVVNVP